MPGHDWRGWQKRGSESSSRKGTVASPFISSVGLGTNPAPVFPFADNSEKVFFGFPPLLANKISNSFAAPPLMATSTNCRVKLLAACSLCSKDRDQILCSLLLHRHLSAGSKLITSQRCFAFSSSVDERQQRKSNHLGMCRALKAAAKESAATHRCFITISSLKSLYPQPTCTKMLGRGNETTLEGEGV